MSEYYLRNLQQDEVYARDATGNQHYIRTDNEEKLYVKEKSGLPKYARKASGKEIYGQIRGKEILLKTPDRQVYARDREGNEVYPRDETGREYLATDQRNRRYLAQDATENMKLPRNKKNAPYAISFEDNHQQKMMLRDIDLNANPVYSKGKSYPIYGDYEIYELDEDNDEKVLLALDADGNERYAKRDGNEYYPFTGQIAKTKYGVPKYAFAKNDYILYPNDGEGNEFYLTHPPGDSASILLSYACELRYARDSRGNEMYPVSITEEGSKEIFLTRYAKDESGNTFYPQDEYQNEYIEWVPSKKLRKNMPVGYPITIDELIIVPGYKGSPAYIKDPRVQYENIKAYLYRYGEGFVDYLTDVPSSRPSRKIQRPWKAYKKKPFELKVTTKNVTFLPFAFHWEAYLLLGLLILSLFFGWLYKK